MSDSFDLLDQLGDQKKVETLKAKLEKKQARISHPSLTK